MTPQFMMEGDTGGILSNCESQLPRVPGPTGKPTTYKITFTHNITAHE